MDGTVQQSLNNQIKHEFDSAYFYLSAAGYFESVNLSGFAHWMRLQAQEEVSHAMKIFDFIHDRGASATLQAIDQPPGGFASPLDAFTQALEHERRVTGLIHDLYGLALEKQDYPAQVLLQWFISEQVEEEKNATQIVEELKMASESRSALLLLNTQMGARTAEPETGG